MMNNAIYQGTQHRRNGERVTWKHLCELEPRLAALYRQAKSIKDDKHQPSFCANDVWYGRAQLDGLKEQLVKLIGWRRKDHPVLGTSLAYDVAYQTIYDVLPACRNCVCWGFQAIVDERMGRDD